MRIYIYGYNAFLLIENELFPLIRLLKWKNTRFHLFAVNDSQKLCTVPFYSMRTIWSCLKSQKCNVIKVYDMRTLVHKESKKYIEIQTDVYECRFTSRCKYCLFCHIFVQSIAWRYFRYLLKLIVTRINQCLWYLSKSIT